MKKSVLSLLVVFAFGLGMSFVSADTLDDSITWMQSKGITNSTGRDTYKADTNVSRQASAKFIVQFAKAMKKKMTAYIYSNAQCAFTDVDKGNSLRPEIQLACKLGYITGKSKKFSPSGTFTVAQAVVTVMRIMEGRKSEKVTPWYKNYFDAATKKWYLSGLDISNPNKPITRGELGLFLYAVAKPAPVVAPIVPPVSTGSVATGTIFTGSVITGSVVTGSVATGNVSPWSIISSGSAVVSGNTSSGTVQSWIVNFFSWAEFSSWLLP